MGNDGSFMICGIQTAEQRAFEGQEVLYLWEFISSWRQPQEEVTSLDQSMSHDVN